MHICIMPRGKLLLTSPYCHAIRQQKDYVTGVKDRRWASNWITLELD